MERVDGRWIQQVADAVDTSQGVPSAATDGIKVPNNRKGRETLIRIRHTAAGARTIPWVLWGYVAATYSIDASGVETDTAVAAGVAWVHTNTTGTLTGSTDQGEIVDSVKLMSAFDRVYLETGTLVGTPTYSIDFCFTDNDGEG